MDTPRSDVQQLVPTRMVTVGECPIGSAPAPLSSLHKRPIGFAPAPLASLRKCSIRLIRVPLVSRQDCSIRLVRARLGLRSSSRRHSQEVLRPARRSHQRPQRKLEQTSTTHTLEMGLARLDGLKSTTGPLSNSCSSFALIPFFPFANSRKI